MRACRGLAGGFSWLAGLLAMAVAVSASSPAFGAGFAPAPPALNKRQYLTATVLSSGQVLIAGGYNEAGGGTLVTQGERFDPVANTWTATGTMVKPRYLHTSTLLPSGKVLVVAGASLLSAFVDTEVYDPVTNAWTATASLSTARINHSATLLNSGKVLVAGGRVGGTPVGACELYDPAANSWSSGGALVTARSGHTATLLPSGKVLIAGGTPTGGGSVLSSAEIYDPTTNSWTVAASMSAVRQAHTATLLPSGLVLIAGGMGPGNSLASAERYDPVSDTWISTPSMAGSRSNQTATLLSSGQVLVTGGVSGGSNIGSAELYDPLTNAWSNAGSMSNVRSYHGAALLASGKVLVAAGATSVSTASLTADLYTPLTTTTTAIASGSNPAQLGKSVTFAAAVAGTSPGGSVIFKDGATVLCGATPLVNGLAICTTSGLSVGMHSITASYGGDSNNFSSVSSMASQQITPASSTTQLTSNANPAALTQSVTLKAQVNGQSPTGTVTFKEGATTLCDTVTLNAGSASCPTASLGLGSHSVTATYNGDGNNDISVSGALSQQIVPAVSSTQLNATNNPSAHLDSAGFVAIVNGESPGGTMTFKDGATILCNSVALISGSASCSTSALNGGAHTITALYSGDASNTASTSNSVVQQVNPGASSTSVMSGANPSTYSQNVTFTATVSGDSPLGSVNFYDGATALCTSVVLSGTVAACTRSDLALGNHSITARYGGDGNNAASTSFGIVQNVEGITSTTSLSTGCMDKFVGNQPFTLSATVNGASASGGVTFLADYNVVLCNNVALSGGSASCTTSTLAAQGNHNEDIIPLTASYAGDGQNAASVSTALSITVLNAGDVVFRNGVEAESVDCPIE